MPTRIRGVSGEWAGWAITHQDFGIYRIERRRPKVAAACTPYYVLLAHPDLLKLLTTPENS